MRRGWAREDVLPEGAEWVYNLDGSTEGYHGWLIDLAFGDHWMRLSTLDTPLRLASVIIVFSDTAEAEVRRRFPSSTVMRYAGTGHLPPAQSINWKHTHVMAFEVYCEDTDQLPRRLWMQFAGSPEALWSTAGTLCAWTQGGMCIAHGDGEDGGEAREPFGDG